MPKAVKGVIPLFASWPSVTQLTRWQGVLVECDPSIKAIILKIDQDKHDYIVEDLDDQTLMVKETQLPKLKARLEEVRSRGFPPRFIWATAAETGQELANTQQVPDDSGSD